MSYVIEETGFRELGLAAKMCEICFNGNSGGHSDDELKDYRAQLFSMLHDGLYVLRAKGQLGDERVSEFVGAIGSAVYSSESSEYRELFDDLVGEASKHVVLRSQRQ